MRRRGLGSVLVGFGTALASVIASESAIGQSLWGWLFAALTREAYDMPHSPLGQLAWRTLLSFAQALHGLFGPLLALSCLAVLGTVIARSVAWARVRDGKADPLDGLRSRHRLRSALTAAPAVLASAAGLFALVWDLRGLVSAGDEAKAFWRLEALSQLIVTSGVAALLFVLTRAGTRALLEPVVNDVTPPKDAGEVVFSAIAITARTRAAVGALAALTVAMIAGTLTAASDPRFLAVLAAYVATAMAAPFVLRRVSRIAVGIDGVWVRDASRARFFAYRDLDEARARGADLQLVRQGRVILRLQMHGEDAGRRDEVLARVNEAVARSRLSTTRGAEMLVQAMPTHRVAATARGADDYRQASVSREQLWELIEGPTTDAATRTAAAQALATTLDDAGRARLQTAAARCAEPRVRVALETLAADDDPEADEGSSEVASLSARTVRRRPRSA